MFTLISIHTAETTGYEIHTCSDEEYARERYAEEIDPDGPAKIVVVLFNSAGVIVAGNIDHEAIARNEYFTEVEDK